MDGFLIEEFLKIKLISTACFWMNQKSSKACLSSEVSNSSRFVAGHTLGTNAGRFGPYKKAKQSWLMLFANLRFAMETALFLRLADGSGWIFENLRSKQLMEEVPIQTGSWTLRALNHPDGIALRRQPIDDAARQETLELDFKTITCFNTGSLITCDRKIESSSENGAHLYRVKDHDGWVFDKCGKTAMLELFSENAQDIGWDVNFVRRIASKIGGVEEIYFNPLSRVVSNH